VVKSTKLSTEDIKAKWQGLVSRILNFWSLYIVTVLPSCKISLRNSDFIGYLRMLWEIFVASHLPWKY